MTFIAFVCLNVFFFTSFQNISIHSLFSPSTAEMKSILIYVTRIDDKKSTLNHIINKDSHNWLIKVMRQAIKIKSLEETLQGTGRAKNNGEPNTPHFGTPTP